MQDNSEQGNGSGNQPELANQGQINTTSLNTDSVNQLNQATVTDQAAATLPQIEPVAWTASDTATEQRSGKWYGIVTAIFIGVLVIIVLLFVFKILDLMAMISSTALIVAMFIALMISTRTPSHESNYVLSGEGIAINGHNHPFNEFRAFGVRQHGGLWQLVLFQSSALALKLSAISTNSTASESLTSWPASCLWRKCPKTVSIN